MLWVARAAVRIDAIPASWAVELLADRLSPVLVLPVGPWAERAVDPLAQVVVLPVGPLAEQAVDPLAPELDSAAAARSQVAVALGGRP